MEAGKRLEELRRRRGETESEEFEKLKQKQQEAALELEELKKKREERRKVLEEEEQRRKQEEADRKAREEVRVAWLSLGKHACLQVLKRIACDPVAQRETVPRSKSPAALLSVGSRTVTSLVAQSVECLLQVHKEKPQVPFRAVHRRTW